MPNQTVKEVYMVDQLNNEGSQKPEEVPGTIEFAKRLASKGNIVLTTCALSVVPNLLLVDGAPIMIDAIRKRAEMDLDEAQAAYLIASIATDPVMVEEMNIRFAELTKSANDNLSQATRRERALKE